MIDCPACGGTGELSLMRCHRCLGEGEITFLWGNLSHDLDHLHRLTPEEWRHLHLCDWRDWNHKARDDTKKFPIRKSLIS